MTKLNYIKMDSENTYGPFNNVFCISHGECYEVIGLKEDKDELFFFEPPAVKYYGDWKDGSVEGDIKNGLNIQKYPIYVFVNTNPEDSDKTRVEVDFS